VKVITIVKSVQLIAWIRQVASLSDTALEEELKLIKKKTLSMHLQEPLGEFAVQKLILIQSEVEFTKLIPTQIQSIYYFLL
jgi:hypothetical protein